jgi:hypothetical protein
MFYVVPKRKILRAFGTVINKLKIILCFLETNYFIENTNNSQYNENIYEIFIP